MVTRNTHVNTHVMVLLPSHGYTAVHCEVGYEATMTRTNALCEPKRAIRVMRAL